MTLREDAGTLRAMEGLAGFAAIALPVEAADKRIVGGVSGGGVFYGSVCNRQSCPAGEMLQLSAGAPEAAAAEFVRAAGIDSARAA